LVTVKADLLTIKKPLDKILAVSDEAKQNSLTSSLKNHTRRFGE